MCDVVYWRPVSYPLSLQVVEVLLGACGARLGQPVLEVRTLRQGRVWLAVVLLLQGALGHTHTEVRGQADWRYGLQEGCLHSNRLDFASVVFNAAENSRVTVDGTSAKPSATGGTSSKCCMSTEGHLAVCISLCVRLFV